MKLFLASTFRNEKIVKQYRPLYVLESFYYIMPWQMEEKHNWRIFMLDSGAFTFMQQAQKSHIAINWEQYMQKYIAFINNYDIKYFFELDIDSIVGYDKVKQMRRQLERETKKQCIPVWHKSRGISEFRNLCREYNYIAIGGLANRTIKPREYSCVKKLVKLAAQYRTRVHGLGFTKKNILEYGFYSVDSSSWTSGARYGGIYYFNGRNIIRVPPPKGKKSVDYKIRDEQSLQEWIKYQRYLDMKG